MPARGAACKLWLTAAVPRPSPILREPEAPRWDALFAAALGIRLLDADDAA